MAGISYILAAAEHGLCDGILSANAREERSSEAADHATNAEAAHAG